MVDLKPPASHSDSTIFDLQLDFLGRIRSDQFGSDAQRKIDPGGDTAAGYYIAVTGYPIEVRCCAEGRQELSGKPMAGSTLATQQSCRTECQRSGAHRRDEACCRSEPTQFRQEGFVEDGIIDASPAGNADDVARIDLRKAMQSADDDPSLGSNFSAYRTRQEYVCARNAGKNHVRPDEIEGQPAREQREHDNRTPPAHRRISA